MVVRSTSRRFQLLQLRAESYLPWSSFITYRGSEHLMFRLYGLDHTQTRYAIEGGPAGSGKKHAIYFQGF